MEALLKSKIGVRTGDGDNRIIEPGDQVLFEDTAGDGHMFDEADGQEYNFAIARFV